MSSLILEGGKSLQGELRIQGAKNSALPVLASTVLCNSPCVIHNCPALSDVDSSCRILTYLGCSVKREGNTVIIDPAGLDKFDIPDTLMREMRSSIVFLGSISAKTGRALISFPGGCELGPRPIDLHLSSLRLLGLEIMEDHGWLDCSVKGHLHGCTIALSFPSVGATENILLAATTAVGTTVIVNAAREPEITDLANFLNCCGAKIHGAGESQIIVEGVRSLHGCEYSVIPDRIVAATYMAATGIASGDVTLKDVRLEHLSPLLPAFELAGCQIRIAGDTLNIRRSGRLRAVQYIRTMPFPGFPTDAQAPVMAMSTVAEGTSIFVENIFENRFKHAAELIRMGAKIKIEGKVAIVEGVDKLFGAPVEASDLRGGAALVVAALAAEGRSEIGGVPYIDRGYESIETDLAKLGASIWREPDPTA